MLRFQWRFIFLVLSPLALSADFNKHFIRYDDPQSWPPVEQSTYFEVDAMIHYLVTEQMKALELGKSIDSKFFEKDKERIQELRKSVQSEDFPGGFERFLDDRVQHYLRRALDYYAPFRKFADRFQRLKNLERDIKNTIESGRAHFLEEERERRDNLLRELVTLFPQLKKEYLLEASRKGENSVDVFLTQEDLQKDLRVVAQQTKAQLSKAVLVQNRSK